MVVMGKCRNCGHAQPGIQVGDSLELLAEDGCAKCGSDTFYVVEDEAETYRATSRRNRFGPSSLET